MRQRVEFSPEDVVLALIKHARDKGYEMLPSQISLWEIFDADSIDCLIALKDIECIVVTFQSSDAEKFEP